MRLICTDDTTPPRVVMAHKTSDGFVAARLPFKFDCRPMIQPFGLIIERSALSRDYSSIMPSYKNITYKFDIGTHEIQQLVNAFSTIPF